MPWVRLQGGARQLCAVDLGMLRRGAGREQPVRAWISEETLLRNLLPSLLFPVIQVVADGSELHMGGVATIRSVA